MMQEILGAIFLFALGVWVGGSLFRWLFYPRLILPRLEAACLIAIEHLMRTDKYASYGVPLRKDVSRLIQSDVSVGSLYVALDKLESGGYVCKWEGEPTPERGGRKKRFWKLTEAGELALKAHELTVSARRDKE